MIWVLLVCATLRMIGVAFGQELKVWEQYLWIAIAMIWAYRAV